MIEMLRRGSEQRVCRGSVDSEKAEVGGLHGDPTSLPPSRPELQNHRYDLVFYLTDSVSVSSLGLVTIPEDVGPH